MAYQRRKNNTIDRAVTDYWTENYLSPEGMCTLCGQKGTIDTAGVRTSAGVLVGRKNFCICPNGQTLRANSTPLFGSGDA